MTTRATVAKRALSQNGTRVLGLASRPGVDAGTAAAVLDIPLT
jgi:hypothetical protein